MVVRHRGAIDRLMGLRRLAHQACLPQQLVALQDQLLVPGTAIVAKSDADAMLPFLSRRCLRGGIGPATQPCGDLLLEGRRSRAVVLPWKIPIPALPAYTLFGRGPCLSRKSEIADGNEPLAGPGPIPVGERV